MLEGPQHFPILNDSKQHMSTVGRWSEYYYHLEMVSDLAGTSERAAHDHGLGAESAGAGEALSEWSHGNRPASHMGLLYLKFVRCCGKPTVVEQGFPQIRR